MTDSGSIPDGLHGGNAVEGGSLRSMGGDLTALLSDTEKARQYWEDEWKNAVTVVREKNAEIEVLRASLRAIAVLDDETWVRNTEGGRVASEAIGIARVGLSAEVRTEKQSG